MELQEVVLVSACRTAIGNLWGSLKRVQARELAIAAGEEAIKRAGVPTAVIDEICMGQILTALQGSLPARQVGMRLGLPARSGAVSINQNCASGMRALEIAAHNIMLGKTDIALVVAVESMTNAPYLMPKIKGKKEVDQGRPGQEDHLFHDALIDELIPGHMGISAENLGARYGITREDCDRLALLSHERAARAIDEGRFKKEIVPLTFEGRKGPVVFDTDEHVDRSLTMESLAELATPFKEDGVVTIGNASGICDAAAAAVLMSRKKADGTGSRTPHEAHQRLHRGHACPPDGARPGRLHTEVPPPGRDEVRRRRLLGSERGLRGPVPGGAAGCSRRSRASTSISRTSTTTAPASRWVIPWDARGCVSSSRSTTRWSAWA